jgi:hypothetical protein
MAHYDVHYSCGHTADIQLFGPNRERQRRLEWLESQGLCPDCFRDKKAKDNAAQNAAAESWSAQEGLPVLDGSQKQCAWAETIRQKALTRLCDVLHGMADDFPAGSEGRAFCAQVRPGTLEQCGIFADWIQEEGQSVLDIEDVVSAFLEFTWVGKFIALTDQEAHTRSFIPTALRAMSWVAAQKDARWWIDNRQEDVVMLVRQQVEEPQRLSQQEAERKAQQAAAQAKLHAEQERQRQLWEKKDAIKRQLLAFLMPVTATPFWQVSWQPDVRVSGGTIYGPFDTEAEAQEKARQLRQEGDPHSRATVRLKGPERLASEFRVWHGPTGEQRIFIGDGYGSKDAVTYYHTGNHRYRPGAMVLSAAAQKVLAGREDDLRTFLAKVCQDWQALTLQLTPHEEQA